MPPSVFEHLMLLFNSLLGKESSQLSHLYDIFSGIIGNRSHVVLRSRR